MAAARYTITIDVETDETERLLEVVRRGVDELGVRVAADGHHVERIAVVPPARLESVKVDVSFVPPPPAEAVPVSKKGS